MKIIFITSNPYYKRHDDNMFVNEIEKKYYIERWELSKIYGREDLLVADRLENVIKVQTFLELDNRLFKEKKNCIIITTMLIPQLVVVKKYFDKYEIPVLYVAKEDLGSWIFLMGEKEYTKKLSVRGMKLYAKNNDCIRKLYHFIRYKNVKYQYVLGTVNFFPENCENFYRIHHVTYDDFMKAQESSAIIKGKYILFVESAFVHHPSYTGKTNSLDKDKYLKKINKYFDFLESQYSMPVVVSAHPKTAYSSNDFGSREIYLYKTPELLQHCTYVVSHYSTSLFQAVLLEKPIAIMMSEDILSSTAKGSMLGGMQFARMINAEILDIDKMIAPQFEVNHYLYEKFKTDYLIDVDKNELTNGALILELLHRIEENMKK